MSFACALIKQQQRMIESLQKTLDSQQERIKQLEELVQIYEKSSSKNRRTVNSAGNGFRTN
jgi:endonuclease V-like protein UPF0215 family